MSRPPVVAEEMVQFAHTLADAARPVLRRYFRTPLAVTLKADNSPVTEADYETERVLRRWIARYRPHDGVIAEEFGAENAGRDWVWAIDPLDGTRAFLAGKPTFGVLIALLWCGQPVLGLIDQPITEDRWIGVVGRRTLFNGAPTLVRPCAALADATLATSAPDLFTPAEAAVFEAFRQRVQAVTYGGDCLNYGLLASGHIDLVIETGLKLYDFAALGPIVEGAGGKMTDWSGQPLSLESDGRVIAVGSPLLFQQILVSA